MNASHVAELLGSCYQISRYDKSEVAGTHGPEIGWDDLMWALGARDNTDVGSMLVRAKWLQEPGWKIRHQVLVYATKQQVEARWPKLPLLRVIDHALVEWLKPELCITCNGSGAMMAKGRLIVCPTCSGDGRPVRGLVSADWLQMLGWIEQFMADQEWGALRRMARKLTDERYAMADER